MLKYVYLFIGKVDNKPEKNQAKRVVLQLCSPFFNTCRRVIFDNFFTSIPLARELLQHGMVSIGTLRMNKKEIPKDFLPTKATCAGSLIYGYSDEMMLVSWTEKKNKSVLFLSTDDAAKPDPETLEKPQTTSDKSSPNTSNAGGTHTVSISHINI